MRKIIEDFLKYLKLRGVSSSSLKYYKSDLVNFLTWAGERKLNQELIQKYIEEKRLTTPTATLKRRISTLRSFGNFIGIKKPIKLWQDNILTKLNNKPKLYNFFHKLFFSRPNWYKTYHSYPIANYVHIAILILFCTVAGFTFYDQVINTAKSSLAYPSTPVAPNKYLSFQGRLTSNLGNPITTATNVVFKLYTASSGGTTLWDSTTCSITPDSDGIFSTLLGSTCGGAINSTVFSENASVWVGVTVGVDAEATPRIQIATVAYALNSETLQGFPLGTGTSTVPYLNSSGELVIAAASPKVQSTSGTFAVEGVALTLTTPNASNGIITINPDGVGTLDLTFEGTAAGASANGFVNATNANITSGALYGGTVASAATGYNFVDFQSGVSPISKFSVNNAGNITTAGDVTISGDDLFMGTNTANYFLMADGINYNPTSPADARTGLGLTAGGAGDIWVEKAGDTMAGNLTFSDNLWLGLGASAGRIEFDDQTLDEINFLSSLVGIGTATPIARLHVNGTSANSTGKSALIVDQYESQDILTASASGTTKLTLQNDGTLKLANASSTISNDSGDINITSAGNVVVTTDGTGNTEVQLPNDSIGPNEIFTTGQTDEYCITYEATGTTWEWQTCGGGSSVWSGLTAPGADLTLSMAAYNTTFNWDPGADSAETNLSLTTQGEDTTAGGDGDQVLLALSQTSNGVDVDQAADSLMTFTNNDANDPVVNGIRFDAGAAGTDFTYGINFDAATVGTAEIVLQNSETIDNVTDGTVLITAPTTSLSGDLKLVGGDILDTNGNEHIRFGTTASAVDEITITNAAANGTVTLAATGGDTDISLSIDSKGADALNLNGTATGDVNLAGGSGGTGCTVTNSNGNLACSGTIVASSLKWNGLTAPDGALTLAHGTNATTFGWTPTAGLDAFTMNVTNNGGSSTNQNGLIINNAVAGSFTDVATESLLKLQQLDTTAGGTTAVTDALLIDSAGASGIVDAIHIANTVGNITNAIDIADTTGTIDKGIVLSGTFTTAGIDAGNSIITNIGNANTDFNSSGGLTLAENLVVQGTTGLTFNTGAGGDITFANSEKIDNDTNDVITITSATTSLSGDLKLVGGDILDTNGNEHIRFGTTASAVDEITITNAAANGTVTLAATGGDTDISLSIDSKGADALNLNGTATGDVNLAGGSGGTGCTVTNSNGNLACSGTITGTIVASSLPWSGLTSPTGALSLNMTTNGQYGTTFSWTPTGALDGITYNVVNNGGSSTNQNGLVINNAVAGSFTDTATESLLKLQQLDTTTAGTTAVTDALLIDSAGASGIVDAIHIANTVGNITNAIDIADTTGTIDKGIVLSGTFTTAGIDMGNSTIINAGNLTFSGGSISDGTDEVDINDALAISSYLQVGGTGATTYSRFGTTAATRSLSGASDVLINGDLELDGVLYLDGENISDAAGISTIAFAADPTAINSYNTLTNGSWLIENPASGNPGIAALMVNQAKGGDIFTASASGTLRFKIGNTGILSMVNSETIDNTVNDVVTFGVGGSAEAALSTSAFYPSVNDGTALGIVTNNQWSDLFLASGAVINYNNDVTLTHAADSLTIAGGVTTLTGSADGTDSLVLTAGDILITNGDLDLSGGDFNVILDAGDEVNISAAAKSDASGVLVLSNTTAASDTAGGEGLDTALTITNYADDNAADTFIGLDVLVTNNATDAGIDDIVYGIRLQNLAGTTGQSNNEYGIYQAGTGWDYGLYVEDDAFFSPNSTFGFKIASTITEGTYATITANSTQTTNTVYGLAIDMTSINSIGSNSQALYLAGPTDTDGTATGINLTGTWDTDITASDGTLAIGSQVTLTIDAGATAIYALCGDATMTGDMASDAANEMISDCSGTPTADYAEIYPTENDIEYGEIVTTGQNIVQGKKYENETLIENGYISISKLQKSDKPYQDNIIGITSNNYGDFTSAGHGVIDEVDHPLPVALNGRVPVKISQNSPIINIGDSITSSNEAGRGMKALEAGRIVGKALEPWDPNNPKDKILVFVENGYYDPTLALNNLGELSLDTSSEIAIVTDKKTNTIINRIGTFKDLIASKVRAGRLETNLISPITNSDLVIDLQPNNNEGASKLVIKGENDEEVIAFNASGDATISGTLYADDIESEKLKKIEELLHEVETNQGLLAESKSWDTNTATTSAWLSLQTTDLFVTGQAAISSLFVSDNFTVKSINSLEGPLSIQSLAATPIEIMAGKITIDTNGNAIFQGNVEIAGDLTINNLVVANSPTSQGSEPTSEITTGEITTNAIAGKAVLSAGQTEIKINNPKLKTEGLIYITPVSSTQNKVLYVKSKDIGTFTVGFNEEIDTDVEFNWWIIELQ